MVVINIICFGIILHVHNITNVVDVRKVIGAFFSFSNLLYLFEKESCRLLIHDYVDPFISVVGGNIFPQAADTARLKESSSTTSLSQFIYTIVSIFGCLCLQARCKVMKHIEQLEIILHDQFVGFFHNHFGNLSASHLQN